MQLVQGPDGNLYMVGPDGKIQQVPPQMLVAMLQQQSSLQQQPKGAFDQILGSIGKGAEKQIKSQAEEQVLGETKTGFLEKLGEALGLSEAPIPSGMTAGVPSIAQVPAFGLEAPAYNLGFGEIGTTLPSAIPEAGASIIPEALPSTLTPGEFSLGAESALPAAEAPGAFSLSGIGSAGNAILPAAGALGALNLAMSQGDAPSGGSRNIRGALQGGASGAALGSYFGPPGAVVGGVLGGLGGLAGSLFGSSKGGRQMTRDEWRKKNMGTLFGEDYQGTLADGSAFDFGKDKFGFGTGEGDIDLSKPAVGRAAAWGNALAGLSGYGSGKDKEAVSTQFTQASTANLKDPNDIGTVKNNYKHFLGKLGITNLEQGQRLLDQNSAQGMNQQDWGMQHNALKEIFSDKPPSGFDKNGKWVG